MSTQLPTANTSRAGRAVRVAAPPRAASHFLALLAGPYPLARWYLVPAASWLAARLAPSAVRPWHLTLAGLAAAASAAALVQGQPAGSLPAAGLVLVFAFCDRADGQLARRQESASAAGAWLDANVDELVDFGLHAAMAAAAAAATGSHLPWLLAAAFLGGKHLFMYGLFLEEAVLLPPARRGSTRRASAGGTSAAGNAGPTSRDSSAGPPLRPDVSLLRALYHLPANADVRWHLAALALAAGWLTEELALLAVYYNLRWAARYALVLRRCAGDRS